MPSDRSRRSYLAAPSLARTIRDHARGERPRECCGFLLGHQRWIRFALPMPNCASTPETRYRIDDRAHLELRRWLRQVRPALEIVGVYHSHPEGDPLPSPTDIREAYYPEWLYVIAGLRGGTARLRSFRIAGGAARETPIVWQRGKRGLVR